MSRKQTPVLHTIGYEGYEIETFVRDLQKAGIRLVVDVRERPISRKKGFSKNLLAQALAEKGIEYVNVKELGAPPEIRRRYHDRKDYATFLEKYALHLAGQEAAVRQVSEWIEPGGAVLVCLEKDHSHCHRTPIAEKLKSLRAGKLIVEHL